MENVRIAWETQADGNGFEPRRFALRPVLFLVALLICCGCRTAQWDEFETAASGPYPGRHWQKADAPEQLGWSSVKLIEARAYSERIGTAAVMIVEEGVVVDAWGQVARNFQCHSMRKSLLSALIGVQVERGALDLSKNLAELGIDDTDPSLSVGERQATGYDLIKARSGIYHGALGESPAMRAARPKRYSHSAGGFWYYNNWDFNALGTIFEQETGAKIFQAFDRDIATPLQMEDFNVDDCRYLTADDYRTPGVSEHRYYMFRMSARDLARFGLLFLRDGRWQEKQILSRAWIQESTSAHSRLGPSSWFGYMWWAGTDEGLYPNVRVKGHCYRAAGWGGHCLIVLPYRNLVVVHRVDTDGSDRRVSAVQMGRLLWHVLDAAGEKDIGPKPTLEAAAGIRLTGDSLRRFLSGVTLQSSMFSARVVSDERIEFRHPGKRIDTAEWGLTGDEFWLKGKIVTGGRKLYLTVILDGNTLKWYDRDGTLSGAALYSRK